MADNRTLQSATPATLSAGDKPLLYEIATFSGDANVLVAPSVPGFVSGAEGSRVFTEAPGDAANGLDVDVTRLPSIPAGANTIGNIGTIATSITPGTSPAHLGKAEDQAHTSGDVGVMALGVRNDALASRASADGDYIPLATTALGEQWVQSSTIGAQADAAASSDTGTFSLMAFIKRGLQNWATLIARIPALVGGYIPVTLAGNVRASFAAKTTVSLTLTSLANAAARQSAVLDFTGTGAIDALLRVITNGVASGTGRLDLYAYAALGDTSYTDGASGSDAAFTVANRLNSRYVGFVQMNAANPVTAMFSLSAAFDGTLPSKVGIIAINNSGQALSATGGDHVIEVQTMVLAA